MKRTVKFSKNFFLFLVPLVLWTSLILLLSFSSGTQSTEQSNFVSDIILKVLNLANVNLSDLMVSELHFWVRKLIGHFGMFAVDGFLAYFSLFFGTKAKSWRLFFMAISFGTLVAAFSEIAQLFTPDRAGLLLDAMIDLVGFAVGSLVAWSLSVWKPAMAQKATRVL